MTESLAPVIILCYNRPRHLSETLGSLRNNMLAGKSDLIIFSDGPRGSGDADAVAEVRDMLQSLTGFKSVTVHKSEVNRGLADAVIAGVSEVLRQYGRAIVLEDDMLSASDFLEYMNDCLKTYQNRPDIFSISGYTPPFSIHEAYRSDVYLVPRTSSWGWATWYDRWQQADWQVTDYAQLQKKRIVEGKACSGGRRPLAYDGEAATGCHQLMVGTMDLGTGAERWLQRVPGPL